MIFTSISAYTTYMWLSSKCQQALTFFLMVFLFNSTRQPVVYAFSVKDHSINSWDFVGNGVSTATVDLSLSFDSMSTSELGCILIKF